MFWIDLKKLRQKKNYCDKNQFTHQSDSESLRSFNEKKIKRPVTVALPYPSPLHQNEGKQQKKIEIESVFHVFSTTLKKGRTFQFLMTISNARSPTLPPS